MPVGATSALGAWVLDVPFRGAPWAFVLVTLEVRQAFRGTFLDGGSMSDAEQYAHSLAWIVFGIAGLLLVSLAILVERRLEKIRELSAELRVRLEGWE